MLKEAEVERRGTGDEGEGGTRGIESQPAVVVSGIDDIEERKTLRGGSLDLVVGALDEGPEGRSKVFDGFIERIPDQGAFPAFG